MRIFKCDDINILWTFICIPTGYGIYIEYGWQYYLDIVIVVIVIVVVVVVVVVEFWW